MLVPALIERGIEVVALDPQQLLARGAAEIESICRVATGPQ